MRDVKKTNWDDYKVNECPMCGTIASESKESVAYENAGGYKIMKRAFVCKKCGDKWEAYYFAEDRKTEKDI